MSMSRMIEEQTKTLLKEPAQWNSHLKKMEELQWRYLAIAFFCLTSFLVLSGFQVPKMQLLNLRLSLAYSLYRWVPPFQVLEMFGDSILQLSVVIDFFYPDICSTNGRWVVWVGGLGLKSYPFFHTGIPRIPTTNPNHQLDQDHTIVQCISWYLLPEIVSEIYSSK